jgi:hypothetical protein
VIPAFNEAGTIGSVVHAVNEFATPIVVDDASHDATAEVSRERGAVLVRQPVNGGLRALMQVSELLDGQRSISATDVGFRLGPRINAAGRMDVAREVVELFTTKDERRQLELAAKLNELNAQRQAEEQRLGQEGIAVAAGHQLARVAKHDRRVGEAGQHHHRRRDQRDPRVASERFAHRGPGATDQEEEAHERAEPGRRPELMDQVDQREQRAALRSGMAGKAQARHGQDARRQQH